MVVSHVSCPALNQTFARNDKENNDSVSVSINYEHDDCNTEINSHDCDSCSQCSNNSIDDEKCSHCSSHNHSSIESNDSASSISHHHGHHHHHHHEQDHCSNHSSWREDLKSTSTCSSLCHTTEKIDYYNNSCNKRKSHYNKLDFIHNNATPEDITAARSLTSSKDYNNKKQKTKCCFCCFRSNTTSRMIVFFIFALCVLGAIAAFFCWPRTPRVSMGGGADSLNGLPPDWWAGERSPIPSQDNTALPARPSLRGTWQINVTLDNRDNWIPTHIKGLDFVMMDSLTLAKFAWASTSNMVLQPGTISPISLTFNVNYQAPDNMDPTFQNLYTACGPLKKSTDQRPALNVLLKVYFHIFGIMWTPIVTATPYTGGILCPIK